MLKAALLVVLIVAVLAWLNYAKAGNVPKTGELAPQFNLPDQDGKTHRLADYRGRWVVLYFYPKDDTPGCTQEACSFRDDLHALTNLGAQIIEVSVDNADSHHKFAEKYHLPFPLLADRKGEVADAYGALADWKVIRLAKRYTFLIDPEGKVARSYLSVDTSRHSKQIIDDLSALIKK